MTLILCFDLINRLQAENEKNENIIRLADKTIETANAEIERLKKGIAVDIEGYASEYDNRIKAKSYKEFAERIKMSIKANVVETLCNDVKGVYNAEHVLDDIDNLLKEMVGAEE